MGSKNIGDVLEAIKVFYVLKKTNIQNSDDGIRKMLVLIWSKEKGVKDEVLKTYWMLYFNDSVSH